MQRARQLSRRRWIAPCATLGAQSSSLRTGQDPCLPVCQSLKLPVQHFPHATGTDTDCCVHRVGLHALPLLLLPSACCACRLSTVRTADSIIVMEQGRVVEEGTHEDLVLEGGIYASLVARQTSTESKASKDPRLVSKGADSVADVHRALAKQVVPGSFAW